MNQIIERAFRLEEQICEIYWKMYRSRCFEEHLINAIGQGLVNQPVYLSMGQEAIAATISVEMQRGNIFCQHRNHSTYLSFGGDAEQLRDELFCRETGCLGGRGGSMSNGFENKDVHLFAHHGFIGENIALAVGTALGDNSKPSIAFGGDAAYEEDYCFPSFGFAATHKLPVLFIVEDNDLAILTPKDVRRSWKITDVAKGFGLTAVDIDDDPWIILDELKTIKTQLPALMNIHTCRHRWHVGIGVDGPPKQDQMKIFKTNLCRLGFRGRVRRIEKRVQKEMERLWTKT